METCFSDLLAEQKDVAFATCVDGRPFLRVFQIMKIDGDNIYFATSPKKDVYRQLRENPKVAFLALKGLASVRVYGVADLDLDDEICQDIFNSNPILSELYSSWKDLAYMRIAVEKADYFNLAVNPPAMLHYEKDGGA